MRLTYDRVMAQPFVEPCSRGIIAAQPCPRELGREVAPRRRRIVLAACVLASSMAFIDGSALTVALPKLRAHFGADLASVQWVLNGYLLALASLTMNGGALADVYGKARVLSIGCVLFALASIGCAIVPSAAALVACRIAQGVAAALVAPASLALIGAIYPRDERNAAVAIWAGASGPNRYTYAEHRDYLFALWDQLNLGDNIIMVLHDWGSALGFDWACRNPSRVKGIAYMEAIVAPLTWEDWPETARRVFQGFRSEIGEEMILQKNMFVERVLPNSVIRKLDEEEMEVYRRPFASAGEDRRPTLTWPRMIPIDGEPTHMVKLVEDYGAWLAQNDLPKLFIKADPGSILVGRQREFCRTWRNQTEVTVKGQHFLQEDSPDEIGHSIAEFARRIRRQ